MKHHHNPEAASDRPGKQGSQGAHDAAKERKQTRPEADTNSNQAGRESSEITEEIHREVMRERDEYLDSLQRLQAEFDNFRRRVQRDSEKQLQRGSSQVIEELLPVLDNFERAMQAAAEHDEKLLTSGVELVYNQLRDILKKRGLCEIEAEGTAFDPNRHEAVLCQPSDRHDDGTVMQVLEKGYHLDDEVVRPSKVIVSSSPDKDIKAEPK